MHIDAPLTRKLLQSGTFEVVPAGVIGAFDQYLCTLPWHPTSLDWTRMQDAESFRLKEGNENDALYWARRMAIGRSSHVVVVYKWDEPGLRGTLESAIQNLGSLFANAPGKNFLFGSNQKNGAWDNRFADFMEFDGGEILTAVR